MVFFCQRNCYSSVYSTTVTSCKGSKTTDDSTRKGNKIDCYEVTFEDTVFFPEGGGQPYDKGHVNDIPVIKVLRKGGEAIHYLLRSIEVGTEVTQVIDWERRHDHMQQHSAQHLITAIADRDYHCATLSWNLGEKVSYIELDTPKLSEDQLSELEDSVNELIRNRVPVLIEEFDASDPKLKKARTRGLPDDVVGPVRLVTIDGVDTNMCCGTHVNNLSDLQAIKLLFSEKGKAGKTLLHFVAGKRTLGYLGECVSRERALNLLLHSNPSDHLRLVEKCKKDLKQVTKSLSEALRDLAALEVFKFRQLCPASKVFFHHRKDGDTDYLGAVVSEINDDMILKVLTAGEDSGPGILMIHGNPDDVKAVSLGVCTILEGKGGGKTRFTAKVNKLSKRKEAEKYVLETLPHLTS